MPTFSWTVSSPLQFSGRIEARMTVPAGGAAVSATNSGGGPTTVTVAAANYYITAAGGVSGLLATFEAQLNASRAPSSGAWTVTIDTGTGLVTINCTGTWSLVWTNTTLRDLLGFTADITAVSAAQTGTKQARGLWFPNCPFNVAGDPYQAPPATDLRQSESPDGNVLAIINNVKYRHRALIWSHVPRELVWESYVTYANASWEYFAKETQLSLGSSWFAASSLVQIYWSNAGTDTLVGGAANAGAGVAGWTIKGLDSIEPMPSDVKWKGRYRIQIAEIVSSG